MRILGPEVIMRADRQGKNVTLYMAGEDRAAWDQARAAAAAEGVSFSAWVSEAIKLALAEPGPQAASGEATTATGADSYRAEFDALHAQLDALHADLMALAAPKSGRVLTYTKGGKR